MKLPEDKECRCGYWILSTSKEDSFTPACEFHDRAYEDGSWHQKNLTRREVDKLFLDQMLLLAGNNTKKIIKAYAFYHIVRKFGWLFWEGKE